MNIHPDRSFTSIPHPQGGLYLNTPMPALGYSSVRQHSQPHHQLRVNTELALLYDSATSSSTPFSNLPPATPSWQHYMSTPFVQSSSPASASADLQKGILSLGLDVPPFPVSPLAPPSPDLDGGAFGDPTSLPLTEDDEEAQEPMPHIVEWKLVIELGKNVIGMSYFIPQKVYQPYTEADRLRYIQEITLKKTIFFYSQSELGILLDDALKQRLKHLDDKDEPMFVGCGPSVSIRLQWPGYRPWTKQIPTMDFKNPKGPITKLKLAKNIANCVRRFIEAVDSKAMEPDSDRRWKVGKRNIKVEDLVLVSLHHVSKGSWQPQLRLRRPFSQPNIHLGDCASSSSQ
ncbi:hypothetical protein PAXINDRAFT_165652 [Paxillus involutus ATCC 200175]|nr:hypothetical protein PAXINDRAFT_165652 [Paxillus involutus ATCC 200175]